MGELAVGAMTPPTPDPLAKAILDELDAYDRDHLAYEEIAAIAARVARELLAQPEGKRG